MNARSVHAAAGVIHAAMRTHQTAAGIAVAVEAAGLLMSPEKAREFEQAKTDAHRRGIAWRRAYQRAMNRGWAADRAGARAQELQTALQDMLGALLGMQMERDAALARVADLEAERHSTNEALHDAQVTGREKDTRIAELEQQLTTVRAKALDEGAEELTTYNDQFDPNCHCGDIYGCPSCIARGHADTLHGMAREGGAR